VAALFSPLPVSYPVAVWKLHALTFVAGEVNADGYSGYLANKTINGIIAQQENCATVVLEHRFYGLSNPYPDLSVKSFRVHTIQQAIGDLDYFAKNVKLPMPNGANVKPAYTPWVLVGGSYAGEWLHEPIKL
jgi:hypothetical protein